MKVTKGMLRMLRSANSKGEVLASAGQNGISGGSADKLMRMGLMVWTNRGEGTSRYITPKGEELLHEEHHAVPDYVRCRLCRETTHRRVPDRPDYVD